MCNDCNCDAIDLCSIVGMQPIGFCCSKCELWDEQLTCMKAKESALESNGHDHVYIKINRKAKAESPELQH